MGTEELANVGTSLEIIVRSMQLQCNKRQELGCGSVVEHLPTIHKEELDLISSTTKKNKKIKIKITKTEVAGVDGEEGGRD
jgi:hypothetical protein